MCDRSVGLTVHPRKVDPPVHISVHEVEVLCHFLQDKQVSREEKLALEHGRRRILGLQRLGRADEGLSAVVDCFLRKVIENSRL